MNDLVLVTGSQGFIGSYICSDLLNNNYYVVGIDNYSKYGVVERSHDNHPNFTLYKKDVQNVGDLEISPNYIISCAAMIGGISYFHKYAYDLLATNERIMASIFDYSIKQWDKGSLNRIMVLSSSMVFESSETFPTPESSIVNCPPPMSTYGFQKLACEYFCRGAYQQYGLPYTIIRPFNCVGTGEDESMECSDGNERMMMGHVLPNLVYKILFSSSKSPLSILGSGDQIRHYTSGKDIARGVRMALESPKAINEDFNISSDRAVSVKELATMIWDKIYPGEKLVLNHLSPFEYDVQVRSPDVSKAKEILGFSCDVILEDTISEVISWICQKYGCVNG